MDAELVHPLDQVDLQVESWIANSRRLQAVAQGFVVELQRSARLEASVRLVPVVDVEVDASEQGLLRGLVVAAPEDGVEDAALQAPRVGGRGRFS